MKINLFHERLAYSHQCGHEDFWLAVYKKAFPDMEFAALCPTKGQGQTLGIDRVIYLRSGKTLLIDEKKREQDYPDILLEYISVDTKNIPGWIEKDLLIDYLAYAFMPSKRCYLFPWLTLKRAWYHYKSDWMEKYDPIVAQNDTYRTFSLPIPIDILHNAIKQAMIIQV